MIWEESVQKANITGAGGTSKTAVPLQTKATDSESVVQEREIYIIVYTIIMAIGAICYLSRSFSFYRMCLRISINLHDMIFRGVTRAKMLFFNNNPSGRILNRFARDINNVDSLLPNIIVDVLDVSVFSVERISHFSNFLHFSGFFSFFAFFIFFRISSLFFFAFVQCSIFSINFAVFFAIRGDYSDKRNCKSMAFDTGNDNDTFILLNARGVCEYWARF